MVYKVDRLSRSLMDFSRIMETFDKYGVSFVSVIPSDSAKNLSPAPRHHIVHFCVR
ncbi:MAG: recombinase family protein [Pirellula sp.]